MNHYCTYFDRGFLIQGLALARSLAAHDPASTLWVLALDDFTASALREMAEPNLRVVVLAELEAGDPELAASQANRTRVEYYFTLSPCWPRWLLQAHAEIDRITYLDADLFFFGSPAGVFRAMDEARASILLTAHRFPEWLAHYEQHGRFNVGFESFRNDERGRACLDDWRRCCLEWCHDRVEGDRYADQKYLDAWPARWGAALFVLDDAGVNLAPWNWHRHQISVQPDGTVTADGSPLVVFHFARFRPIRGDWWWQSGQLDYGVMPGALRRAIYGRYWCALAAARGALRVRHPDLDFPRRPTRLDRAFARGLLLRAVWGSDWLRVGESFWSGRLGLGRWSGQVIAKLRTIFLRRKRTTESASHSAHRQAGK